MMHKLFMNVLRVKLETWFLFLSVFFGALWFVIIPPFQAPDDVNHYARAYMISEGKLCVINDAGGSIGAYLPREIEKVCDKLGLEKIAGKSAVKQDLGDLQAAYQVEATLDDTTFYNLFNTGLYSPLPYLAQAVGIAVGRWLQLPLLYGYSLGKLGNLLLFIFGGYCAVRTMPVLRLSMFVICLMPVLMNEAVSMNADIFVIGVSLFFTAYVFRLAFDETVDVIGRREIGILAVFMILLGLAKSAYLPLAVLFFLIPVRKFVSLRQFIITGAGLCLLGAATCLIWGLTFRGMSVPFPMGINPAVQLAFILHHPLKFLSMVWHAGSSLADTVFALGWADTHLPSFIGAVYVIAVFLPCVMEGTVSPKFNGGSLKLIWRGGICLLLFLAMYVEMHIALYMSWIQPFPDRVHGVQGRYFLPFFILLPMGVFLLKNSVKVFENRQNQGVWSLVYFLVFFAMLSFATKDVLFRYYMLPIIGW